MLDTYRLENSLKDIELEISNINMHYYNMKQELDNFAKFITSYLNEDVEISTQGMHKITLYTSKNYDSDFLKKAIWWKSRVEQMCSHVYQFSINNNKLFIHVKQEDTSQFVLLGAKVEEDDEVPF